MARNEEWRELEREILERTDVRQVYVEEFGVRLRDPAQQPNPNGWLSCHAIDRVDEHPSAAICVEGQFKGRYKDSAGRGPDASLNFFEFAARHDRQKRFEDWRAARKHYAAQVKVRLPKGAEPKNPRDHLDLTQFLRSKARDWCRSKGGFDVEALEMFGAQMGSWPKFMYLERRQQVIALPGYGPDGTAADPVSWTIYEAGGGKIQSYDPKSKTCESLKVKSLGGSEKSWLNRWALDHLAQAELVWKTEGPTDCLAVQQAILDYSTRHPPETGQRPWVERHVAITNGHGASEAPLDWQIRLLTGKVVAVCHDADKPGQYGARAFIGGNQATVREIRNVELPYTVQEDHGRDARDFLKGVHDDSSQGAPRRYEDLLALYNATQNVIRNDGPIVTQSGLFSTPAPGPNTGAVPLGTSFTPAPGPSAGAVPSAPSTPAPGPSTGAPPMNAPSMPVAELPPGMARGQEAPPPIERPFQLQTRTMEVKYQETIDFAELDVLGHYPDDSIEVYSRSARKVQRIKDIGYWNFTQLVYTLGPASQRFHGGREAISSMRTLDDLKVAIAYYGGKVSLIDRAPIGEGIWWAGDQIVLVNGGQGAVLTGGKLDLLDTPRVGDRILDWSRGEAWVDFDVLRQHLDRAAASPAWCQQALAELVRLLARWPWRYPVDARVVACLVVASWVQTLWRWRPQVALAGPTQAGKTTLIDSVLRVLFGQLASLSTCATEAAIRQELSNRSLIVFLDELDRNPARRQILDLIRGSTRGTRVIRGTADHAGRAFLMRHIVWMAGIEMGLTEAADANRTIQLELVLPTKREPLHLPSEEELADLGVRLLAVALTHVERALALAESLNSYRLPKVPQRLVECYAIPAAVWSAVHGMDNLGACNVIEEFLQPRSFAGRATADEVLLLRTILQSIVPIGRGERLSVAEILGDDQCYRARNRDLARVGIMLTWRKRGPRPDDCRLLDQIFVECNLVERALLQGTRWAGRDIAQVLERIPGARRCKRRLPKLLVDGVLLPRAAAKLAHDMIAREDASAG
jgi:hypothetical protein